MLRSKMRMNNLFQSLNGILKYNTILLSVFFSPGGVGMLYSAYKQHLKYIQN